MERLHTVELRVVVQRWTGLTHWKKKLQDARPPLSTAVKRLWQRTTADRTCNETSAVWRFWDAQQPTTSAVTSNIVEQNMKGPSTVTEALSTGGKHMKGPPAGNKTMKAPPTGTEALSTIHSLTVVVRTWYQVYDYISYWYVVACYVYVLLEPQSRFEYKLLGIRVKLSPKRGCGSFYSWTSSTPRVCCLHIKPFFLRNDISTPSVRADSS